jgi:hypothetical protein
VYCKKQYRHTYRHIKESSRHPQHYRSKVDSHMTNNKELQNFLSKVALLQAV